MRGLYVYLLSLSLFIVLAVGCSPQVNNLSDDNKTEDINTVNEVVNVELKITSPAFGHNEKIPSKYTCDGDNVNPPLEIEGIPESAKSLVLIVDDPDAPAGNWDHWIVWNIPLVQDIEEDSIPGEQGMNDFKRQSWGGPCPPSGTHRYFFKLYALDTKLSLERTSVKKDVESAMQEHILSKGELIGLYERE